MKKTILNLEGVETLSKKQMQTIKGAGYLTGFQCTGNVYQNTTGAGDPPTAFECTAQYQQTFLGGKWGKPQDLPGQVFPCPVGLCESQVSGPQPNGLQP